MREQITRATLMMIFAGLLIPQITFAAWWNPVSWFKNQPVKSEVSTEGITESEIVEEPIKQSIETVEKVVEKTITVDNPELQKKINALLQENYDLKIKISSLTSELNSCKLPKESSSESNNIYSDFELKYETSENTISLLSGTSRALKIRKSVFHIRPGYSSTFMESFRKLDTKGSLKVGEKTYQLERTNDTTFSYLGSGISIVGSEDIVIEVKGSNGVGYRMEPDWQLWEIWDYTVGKPVRIE